MKLHLGCGQVYLDGYLNIDYPLSKHSVQLTSVADKYADITKLKYKPNSVEEIRLHHVFEHFDRSTAVALVATWSRWLKKDGILRIDVPDFVKTARSVLSPFTSKRIKDVGIRHIFGSQEASWAVHYHGWSDRALSELFQAFGLEVISFSTTKWKGTYNVQVIGKKYKSLSEKDSIKGIENWLKQFLVDDSKSERDMLAYWKRKAKAQLEVGWIE